MKTKFPVFWQRGSSLKNSNNNKEILFLPNIPNIWSGYETHVHIFFLISFIILVHSPRKFSNIQCLQSY